MENNFSPKKEENVEKNAEYFKNEVRKNNIAFLLCIIRMILHITCLITIFTNSVVGVLINLFSAYFGWIIAIAVNDLNGTTVKQKFKMWDFKFLIALFILVLIKSII